MLEFEAIKRGKTLVLGHRGAAGHAPENTMISFKKGIECGSDMLELDIHVSSDGEVVVMHDSDVVRTTNGKGPIENMTLAEIKKLDAGIKFDPKFAGERVPTLKEVFDYTKGRIPVVVEIKGDPFPTPGVEEKLVKILRDFNIVEETMAIAFHHSCLKRLKEIEPRLKTGVLYVAEIVDPLALAKMVGADSLRPGWQYWTKDYVGKVQAAGLSASTWNANTRDVMDRLVPMGFASIGADFPDRLRAYIDEKGLAFKK